MIGFMGTIIYLAGLVCAVWCVLDIWKKPMALPGKVITALADLLTSWVGSLIYYFWAREHVTEWFK